MVVAYLRVSTNKQHLENQQEEIKKFAAHRGLDIDKWYHDVVSGKVHSNDRKLGDLLESLQEGDCLIVTEVSRLSRTLIDIMNIINTCIQRKIVLHSTNPDKRGSCGKKGRGKKTGAPVWQLSAVERVDTKQGEDYRTHG